MTVRSEVNNDPRLKQAKVFLQEKLYEEALNLLSSLVESSIEKYGQDSLQSAIAHYEYGCGLLTKEEDSANIMGNVDEEQGDEDDEDDEEQEATEKNNKESTNGNAEESGEAGEDGGEQVSDLQIAFEVLDLSRHILSNSNEIDQEDYQKLLADIYMRIGDLFKLNEIIDEAIGEYHKALVIYDKILPVHDRRISDAHYSLAIAHMYKSSDQKEATEKVPSMETALNHYENTKKTLQAWISANTDNNSEDVNDVKELVDELNETIHALTIEIEEMKKGNPITASNSSSTTTIGFGTTTSSSSSSSNNAAKRKIGEVDASGNTSSNNTSITTANTVQVKKKKVATIPISNANEEKK